jgi:molecular chaperone DnaK
LSDEEIDKMMKDAEANAEADAKRKEEVDLKNEVDATIFATEKQSKKLKAKALIQNVTHKLHLMN